MVLAVIAETRWLGEAKNGAHDQLAVLAGPGHE